MMRVELRPASPAHIGSISARMRDADRIECAAFRLTPKDALRQAMRGASIAATAFVDGRPEAMLGASCLNAIEGIGRPWMLATDRAFDCARPMLVLGPEIVGQLHGRFTRLENMVWRGNARAIRMLRRWGFTIGEDAVVHGGLEFLPFWRISDVR